MSDQSDDSIIDQRMTEEIADAGVAGGAPMVPGDVPVHPGGLPVRTPQYGALHWLGRVLVFAIPLAYLLLRVFGVTGIFGDGWSNSGLGLLADALIVAIAVMGVNLITGYTGQLSIGHSAFFAIGAYTGLILTQGRVSTPFFGEDNVWDPGWTIPVAAAICFVVGCVVGLPALRLKGIYLALTTLVFVEAVRSALKYEEFESVTGGSTGIKGDKYTPPEYVFDFFGIRLPTGLDGRADLNQWMIYVSLALLLFIMLLVSGVMRSRIGRAMVATRDNELAAEVMGVHLAVIKTVVFGLSGAVTGVGGVLFGLKLGLVDADIPLFGLFGAITFLVAMVVGGAAQNWGPLVGAVFFIFVNELARTVGENPSESVFGFLFSEGTKLDGLGGVIFGILLILFARFAPFGAVGTFRILRGRVVQVIPKPPAGSRAARAADAE
jgi:branched-chain amino acid transport system permease protein